MSIQLSKKAKQLINAPLPQSIIKERQGGGKQMLSYLSGSTVIDMLNSAFDYKWSWETDKEWITESVPFINKYKNNEEEPQGPVAHVKGILTVFLEGEDGKILELKKTGYGSKSVLGKQNDQESIFKAAATDALKKAASLLGIGTELYRDEEEQQFFIQLSYEDPWTEEAKEAFKAEREYLAGVMEKYELDDEAMNALVYNFSGGTIQDMMYITPENIKDFHDYVKKEVSALESEGKEA